MKIKIDGQKMSKGCWVDNFQYMCSKDNDYYPSSFREYFDTPREYDVNGSRRYLVIDNLGKQRYYQGLRCVLRYQFPKIILIRKRLKSLSIPSAVMKRITRRIL